MTRLAIVGTRVLACDGDRQRVAARVKAAVEKLRPAVIISGGAKGVDEIAETVTRLMGYDEADGTLIIHRPTTRKFHGPGGYRERDAQIAQDCTHLLRLACRQATTYGSGWTADEANRLGRVVVRALMCPEPNA